MEILAVGASLALGASLLGFAGLLASRSRREARRRSTFVPVRSAMRHHP
ncbi:hypothetical protein [Microbacterium tumbae]